MNIERIKYEQVLKEDYPETYSLRHVESISHWLEFGYVIWLKAKDDLSRELLNHEKVR